MVRFPLARFDLQSRQIKICARPLSFLKWGSEKGVEKFNEDPTMVCFKQKPSQLCPGGDSSQVDPKKCSVPRVVVAGAGMAGLSAACLLHCRGIKDVVVLEATNRPGGRIFSSWLGDSTVEFGPAAIEGASLSNPVYNLANIAGIVQKNQNHTQPKAVFLTRDGRTISEYKLEELVFQHILNQSKKLCQSEGPQINTSLLQFISLRIQQELLQFPPALRYDSERILFGLANGMKSRLGADLENISAAQLSNIKQLPGSTVYLQNGFNSIITPLLIHIPEDKLLFNKKVVSILELKDPPKGKKRVQVQTSEGEVFDGDFVIVALPMGFLKEHASVLFKNELDNEKMTAINKIGVGTVNRIFLEYASPWWSVGGGNIKLAWSGEELSYKHDWTKGIGEISEAPNSKHVIYFTVGGAEALLLENTPETEIAIEFTKFLRKFSGDSSIPYPKSVLASHWGCDPHCMGSTVYMGIDTRVGHFKTLGGHGASFGREGKPPAILFAGDGTIPDYFGTVLGARKSGIREANRIIEYTLAEIDKEEECPQECECKCT